MLARIIVSALIWKLILVVTGVNVRIVIQETRIIQMAAQVILFIL
jgi:hypothetical protein